MKCQRCGRTIEEEVQFCPFCGHKAEPQPAKEVVEQAPAEEAAPAEPVAAPEPEVAPEPGAPAAPEPEVAAAPEPVEAPVETAEPAPAPEPEVPAAAAAAMPFAAASAPVATPVEPMVTPTQAFGSSASPADPFLAPSSTVSDPFLAPSSTVSEPAASTAADPFLAPAAGTSGAEAGFAAPAAAPAEPVAAAPEAAPFAAPAAAPAEPFAAAPATPDMGAQPQDAFIPPQPQAPQGDFDQAQFNQPPQGTYMPPQTGQVPPAGFTQPQMGVPVSTKPPLSERTWFIVLLLLFLWPVGLFLMWRKGCTWSTVAKVIVTVVIVVLVGFNIWSIFGNNASTTSTSTTSTTTSQSTSGSSSSSSSSSSTAATPSASTAPAEASDSYGNPSMYLCLAMSGADAKAWLEDNGYSWNSMSEAWMNSDGLGWVAVKDAEATSYTETEVDGLAAAGVGDPVAYLYTISGYDDTEDALSGNSQCVVEDSETIDNTTIAVIYGPTMEEAFAMVQDAGTEGELNVIIFNKEAIEAGMVDEISGYSVGTSISEVWETLTGRSI